MKKLILLATVLAAAAVVAGFVSTAADAKALRVEIGNSPATATEAESHTLTMESLQAGKGAFKVKTAAGSYDVSLTEKQIKELLGGTTVMAKTAGDTTLAVTVSLVEDKKKEKGW